MAGRLVLSPGAFERITSFMNTAGEHLLHRVHLKFDVYAWKFQVGG